MRTYEVKKLDTGKVVFIEAENFVEAAQQAYLELDTGPGEYNVGLPGWQDHFGDYDLVCLGDPPKE